MVGSILDEVILFAWLTPFLYLSAVILGEWARRRNLHRYQTGRRNVDRMIFQIPTLGNYETTNRTFDTVRGYNVPIPLECWVLVEEDNECIHKYNADRVVIVPREFTCGALYKARALEYARQFRLSLVDSGKLPSKYLVLQADDDSTPSREFVEECARVDADLIIGTVTPRARGIWNTILDYERCIACSTACNFWTNIGVPVWAHGEGFCISAPVDSTVDYSFPTNGGPAAPKIISSEDMVYTHKVAHTGRYRLYNSSKPVYITPPLSFKDAVKQRRRWEWGHIRIVRGGLLPLGSRIRVGFYETIGLLVYGLATVGISLRLLGIVSYSSGVALLTYTTLLVWFLVRGYSVGRVKGFKHAVAAMLSSYLTVTLNFIVHLIGLVKGDPKKFEVIAKA